MRRAVVLALLALLAVPAGASAGTYVVSACGVAGLHANASWTALPFGDEPITAVTGCSGPNPLRVADALGTGRNVSGGTTAGWTLTAPAGTTIREITYRRRLRTYLDEDWIAELLTADGALEACQIGETGPLTCDLGGAGGAERTFTALSTPSLTVRIRCTPTPPTISCDTGASIHRAEAEVHSAQVTLGDPTPPSLVGSPGGTLLAGGWIRGPATVTAQAADATGIQRFRVLVDGAEAALDERALHACDYRRLRPCLSAAEQDAPGAPAVDSAPMTLDTATLTDGEHAVAVETQDAAGNATASAPLTVRTDNTPPAAPTPMAHDGGAWSQGAERVVGLAPPPADSGAPVVAAHVRLCRTTAPADCSDTARHAGDLTHVPVAVPGDGAWTIAAALEDAAGNVGALTPDDDARLRRDTTPPGLTLLVPAAATDADPIGARIDASDPLSGVDASLTRILATHTSTGAQRAFASGDRLPAGTWELAASAEDRAGNVATDRRTVVVTPAPAAPAPPAPEPPPALPPTPAPTDRPTGVPTAAQRLAAVRVGDLSARWTRRARTTPRARPTYALTLRARLRSLPPGTTLRATFQPARRSGRVRLTTRREGTRVVATLSRRTRGAGTVRLTLRLRGATRTVRVRVR
jgi:hypothetical protein